jgi:pyrrolidone-carboxylate peptidase
VKVLVTGFVPWGKHRVNPSGELAGEVGGHLLPVDFDRASRELRCLIRKNRPRAIVMMGLAPGRKRINLEVVALNLEHRRRGWRKIRKGGPLRLMSRLPVDRLLLSSAAPTSRDGLVYAGASAAASSTGALSASTVPPASSTCRRSGLCHPARAIGRF